MRIGILETGRPPEQLLSRHGSYCDMTANWAENWGAPSKTEFSYYAVIDGDVPTDPNLADIWIITGSRCATYEDHAWIKPLESLIVAAQLTRSKMFGICFGHQIIAQALGGRVEKSSKGWGAGVHSYAVGAKDANDWPSNMGKAPQNISMQVYHQDQVVDLPKNARRVASSKFCPNAVLHYPGFAFTVQGHPEFNAEYMRDLILIRRETSLPTEVADRALPLVEQPNGRHELAKIMSKNWDGV